MAAQKLMVLLASMAGGRAGVSAAAPAARPKNIAALRLPNFSRSLWDRVRIIAIEVPLFIEPGKSGKPSNCEAKCYERPPMPMVPLGSDREQPASIRFSGVTQQASV